MPIPADVVLSIVVAAVLVFIASSLVHMAFKWHNADYGKLPDEDAIRAAINRQGLPPGQYTIPHCVEMKEMGSPEMQKKFTDGPVGFLLLRPSGLPRMGPHLGKWFLLNLLVAGFAAHIVASTLSPAAGSLQVFQITALVSFLAYGIGSISDGIWKAQPWKAVAKDLLDALIYAGVSGLAFHWLW